ncbi:MAG: hypothetical protein LBK73_12715 [Treponema sp.]|jgi:hypothetical protein|nr:hypothetical protein [Treponema sp.]
MKKTRIGTVTRAIAPAIAAVLMALMASGCGAADAAGVADAGGNGVLSIGCGEVRGRAITAGKDLPAHVLAALRYDFMLAGPDGETLERSAYGGETLSLSVRPGAWSVAAQAFLAGGLAGTGSASVTVSPGYNAVRIPMLINAGYFDVIIPEFSGGVITASPPSAFPGTRVTLTVTPKTGLFLKPGSLKTDPPLELKEADGDSVSFVFVMPESDVRVTEAVFAAPFGLAIQGPQDTSVRVYCDYTGPGDPVVSYTAGETLTFWVDDPSYAYEAGTLKWLVDGQEKTGAGNELAIHAGDYIVKRCVLTVMIKNGNNWYSLSGDFVVKQ